MQSCSYSVEQRVGVGPEAVFALVGVLEYITIWAHQQRVRRKKDPVEIAAHGRDAFQGRSAPSR